MNICIMGDSHSVAIRLAWERMRASAKGVEGTFFAASGSRLKWLELRRRSLVSPNSRLEEQLRLTSGGKPSIRIDDYDGFVLVGLRSGAGSVLRVASEHRTLDTIGKAPFDHLISDAALDLAVKRFFEDSPFARIARLIRSVAPKAPIVGLMTPLPSPQIAERNSYWRDTERLMRRTEPVWRETRRRFAERHGLAIVDQPPETIENGVFTKAEYGRNSVSLASVDRESRVRDEDEEDMRHMNADYGALLLRAALSHVGVSV